MARNLGIILAIAICLSFSLTFTSSQGVTPAPACPDENSTDTCDIPNCLCSGVSPPALNANGTIPQLVFLTFDDAVTVDNFPFYQEALFNRKNPNGQPITATFFITHEYTNYSMIHELWRKGHEIAFHSISHNPSTDYWEKLNETMWVKEIADQRTQVATFARIPALDVVGMRAPFLQTGGDTMYKVLQANRFTYECSRPTLIFRNPGLWPYTNDYQSTQDCQIPPCPVGQYKGFWTVPMVDLMGGNGEGCAMADACIPVPTNADETFNLLKTNFDVHRNGNRAPFGIFIHAGWINGTGSDGEEQEQINARRVGYERFLDHLATLNDTYMVSVSRGLKWVQNPTPVENLANFDPFKVTEQPNRCTTSIDCYYAPELTPFPTERWMNVCGNENSCPMKYPWVGNPSGRA